MSKQAYNETYGARTAAATGSNDPSQANMLGHMRDRLNSLSDEARSIRSQVPREFEPDVERIQQQMQRLGERLSELSRGALVPYNSAERRASEARFRAVRYVTEEDVRVARVRPDEIISLGGPMGGRSQEDMVPWDEAAAKALYDLYDSGEAYMGADRRERNVGGTRGGMQAVAARSPQHSFYGAPGSGGMAEAPQRGQGIDSNWLDQRFADIAARIEQSLAQIRPDMALASLGRRFDQLETQLNSVLGHVATRADLDELRVAEGQIEEIAGQLAQFRRQLARLDVIDAHLGTLTSQLSDERLTRLFNEGVQVSADVGRLDAIDAQLRMIAVQLSDERLSGLVSRSASRDANYEEIANAAAQRTAERLGGEETQQTQSRDIGEMRGMLESLIHERRNSDENNASMLETMQQAIIRVLDRMDVLEDIAQQQASAGSPQPQQAPRATSPMAAAMAAPAPAPTYNAPPAAAYGAPVSTYDDLVPPTATVYAEMPRAEAEPAPFLPMQDDVELTRNIEAYREDAEAEQPPRVPLYTTSSFDLDAAFSSARDAEAASFGEPPATKRSMEVLRHDFIADAHRAKLKAAAKPDSLSASGDQRSGELSVGPREGSAKPRRSIFSFRSQRVAMTILVILAAIPAAIFFMPRTSAPDLDAMDMTPAAIVAPMPKAGAQLPADDAGMDAAPMAPAPQMAPTTAPPKQTKQVVPPLEKGEYQDVNATNTIDTASLPGISMQDNNTTAEQVAQMSEQTRMARLSGQLGLAAAKATPASLMEEHVLSRNGGMPADDIEVVAAGESKLPPATVGPFSLRLAAAKGDSSAQFEVASRLAEGKGTDQDLKEAAMWYQRAASSGLAVAQFRLGTLYERGTGVKPDLQRAQIWYERAAGQGNVKAMHNLAVLAASRGPKGDYETAARWFQAAAEHGLADSQYNLAVLYENGMGVKKDVQEAYKWLLLAAKAGDKDAAGRRDTLKAKLGPDELTDAEAAVSSWRSKPIVSMANDARVAGQAWKGGPRRG